MRQIKLTMDGYTFAGYVRENSFWDDDLTQCFHSLEDVYEQNGQFIAQFKTVGSPGFAEDGCTGQHCPEISCIHCQAAQRQLEEKIIPFGLSVKLENHIIKPLPELGAIKDAYAKPVKRNRRPAPTVQQHRKHGDTNVL